MDWYAWLCNAALDTDQAYEYALLFDRNELGAADVRHLDHDFLASMGVDVAKHRLEILKLARKESSRAAAITVLPWRATRLLAAALHRSAKSLAGYIRSVARRDRAGVAVAVAPRPPRALCHRGGGRAEAQWKRSASSVARRSRKLGFLKHESKPMLTNSGAKRNGSTTDKAAAAVIAACFASPETCSYHGADEDGEEEMDGGKEMPWESMFQDLKLT